MQSQFTKAADVFSFGISILELACNLELPKNGPLWSQLRNDIFPLCLCQISPDLQIIIRSTMRSSYQQRPDVNTLLMTDKVQDILAKRRHSLPLKTVVIIPNFLKITLWFFIFVIFNCTICISKTERLSKANWKIYLANTLQISKSIRLVGISYNFSF